MKPEAINKAMAELDGWEPTTDGGICWDINGNPIITYPPYTDDLNAVARVVGKLDCMARTLYRAELRGVCIFRYDEIDAPARQRCEAILRAVGKWVQQ